MNTNETADRAAVESLKQNWAKDPCWDLEETEGFKEYREELKAFAEQKEKEWEEFRAKVKQDRIEAEVEAIAERAQQLGLGYTRNDPGEAATRAIIVERAIDRLTAAVESLAALVAPR